MTDIELKLPDWYGYELEPCNDVHESEEKALSKKRFKIGDLILILMVILAMLT